MKYPRQAYLSTHLRLLLSIQESKIHSFNLEESPMSDYPSNPMRRHLIKIGAIGLFAAPTANLLVSGIARAAGAPALPKGQSEIDESDPQAVALGYKHDATEVDPKYKRDAGQICANCQLYSGTPGSNWGPCAIFSYRLDPKTKQPYTVSAQGWCLSWGPRANAKA
jgi:hypothetical protein